MVIANTQEVLVNGVGTKIFVDTEDDLVGLDNPFISYRKPVTGDTGTWVAQDEGDGVLSYTTTSPSDLDEVGRWCLQANVEVTNWAGAGKKTKQLLVLSNCTD